MPDLATFQADFVRAMTTAGSGSPIAAQAGFAVYRNTSLSAAVDALVANYPTVETIIGSEAFEEIAVAFATDHRPSIPMLSQYGEAFPDYLAMSDMAAELRYLPDVARIDRLWTEAYFAADAEPLCLERLAGIDLSSQEAEGIRIHPASRQAWFDSPAATVWLANQGDFEELVIDWQPEGVHIFRAADGVVVERSELLDIVFLELLAGGDTLVACTEGLIDTYPEADMPSIFARMLTRGVFTLAAKA